MYHSFRIPRHGMSNTIDNIELNSFYALYYLFQNPINYFLLCNVYS